VKETNSLDPIGYIDNMVPNENSNVKDECKH
jgi:hypothetical protein